MKEPEIGDIEAMFKRRIANDSDTHASEIALRLVSALRETRRELEKERARRFNLETRVNGAGWGIR